MTSINTKASVLAVTVETTEGTPVPPSSGSDFLAQQDDVSFEPSFEQLENAELKNSLGKAKTLTGTESPTATFSHYLRHSGVEGTAPAYGPTILKALFGSETTDADEETTAAGSTAEVVVLSANGSHHPRGSALLLKNGAGYEIRPVHSQSGENLTLGFDTTNVMGAGVDVGKAVTYSPSNTISDFQTLTLWEYLGNEGAVEMIAGSRPISMDITAEAGQLINASYNFEGIEFYFNPITITSSNKYVDFNDGGVQVAEVATGTYKDPHQLADALATAMDAESTDTITCTYDDSTGIYNTASDGLSFSILWKTGVHGADNADDNIGPTIGYSDAADDTGATSYDADSAMDWSASYTPSYDSADPIIAKSMQCFIGEHDDNVCFDPSSVSISFGIPKADIMSVCAESGKSGSIPSEREIEITATALLSKYDADRFRRMRENSTTRFALMGGVKSGGNWTAGTNFCIYCPTSTVTSMNIADADGLVEVTITLMSYVDDSGNGEFYISFV